MENKFIYSVLFSCMVGLVGCGSDDDSSHNNSGIGTDTNIPSTTDSIGGSLTDQAKILDIYEGVAVSVTYEALMSGVVDTIVWGTDEALAGEKCSSGEAVKTENKITFTNCKGLYKRFADGQFIDALATGVIEQTELGVKYSDLKLSYNDEVYTYNGLVLGQDSSEGGSISTDKLTLVVKGTEQGAITETYTLTDYKIDFKELSATTASTSVKGILSAQNSAVGNYKVSFESLSPFEFYIDEDGARTSFPYVGGLKIIDANNDKSKVVIEAKSVTQFNYTVVHNGTIINDTSENWSDY